MLLRNIQLVNGKKGIGNTVIFNILFFVQKYFYFLQLFAIRKFACYIKRYSLVSTAYKTLFKKRIYNLN